MCCNADPKAKREFLKGLGRRKTFWAWKVVRRNGVSQFYWRYRYLPGVNRPARRSPSGLHVYLSNPSDRDFLITTVRVQCHRDDLWCVGLDLGYEGREAVLRKLIIRKKDWLKAGLPKEAVKR